MPSSIVVSRERSGSGLCINRSLFVEHLSSTDIYSVYCSSDYVILISLFLRFQESATRIQTFPQATELLIGEHFIMLALTSAL